jgi:hypothetical protein
MEEVYTPQPFSNSFVSCMVTKLEGHIPTPVDDVTNLELFSFDHQKKKAIMKMHKKRKIVLDHEIMFTIENVIMDTRKYNINSSSTIFLQIT